MDKPSSKRLPSVATYPPLDIVGQTKNIPIASMLWTFLTLSSCIACHQFVLKSKFIAMIVFVSRPVVCCNLIATPVHRASDRSTAATSQQETGLLQPPNCRAVSLQRDRMSPSIQIDRIVKAGVNSVTGFLSNNGSGLGMISFSKAVRETVD